MQHSAQKIIGEFRLEGWTKKFWTAFIMSKDGNLILEVDRLGGQKIIEQFLFSVSVPGLDREVGPLAHRLASPRNASLRIKLPRETLLELAQGHFRHA